MNFRLSITVILVLVVTAGQGGTQTTAAGSAVAVDHSVPFGTVPGKLLLLGNYLVFVDEQQPSASFVISKSAIENLNADGTEITVQTNEAVRNRSGEVRRLSFRVGSGTDLAVVTSWYGSGMGATPLGASIGTSTPGTTTYQARHDHRFGECRGRLIVAPTQLSYGSVTSVGDSRRWEYQDIKESKLSNPYELEIKPFTGDTYKFHFEGTGMDPAAYKELVDRITASRSKR